MVDNSVSGAFETPPGHTPINPRTMSPMSLKDGQLYWYGEKVKTETSLGVWIKFWIVVNALALFLNALVSINKELCVYNSAKSCIEDTVNNTIANNT